MPPNEKKDATASAAETTTATLETVIIFDWDDTLLASSYLSGRGYKLDSNVEKNSDVEIQLRELEQSVINVLSVAMSYGPVHVVTNAETGWVQLSANKFMPNVAPILSKLSVVSARSTYEQLFPEAPVKWKQCAFQEKISALVCEDKEKNVISFGDSHVEREAVRAVTKGMARTRTKSVKFAERPSMEQLRRQIELVTNCFQYIFHHDADLDLQLTISPTTGPASPNAAASNPSAASAPQSCASTATSSRPVTAPAC